VDGGRTGFAGAPGSTTRIPAPKLERIPQAGGSVLIDAGDRTPGFTISAVRFIDRTRGWITGFYANLGRSLILRTDDAGASWRVDGGHYRRRAVRALHPGHETRVGRGRSRPRGPQAIYRLTLARRMK
jgi:hypothetical protein